MTDRLRPLPPDITLRAGRDTDGPALASLIASVFSEYEGCPFLPEEFPELAAPARHYGRGGGTLWVAEDQSGRVVGCLAATPGFRPGEYEIFKVYVDRAQRGRGLAGAMLDRAVAHAAGQGAVRLVLWSDTRFLDGHRFYARNGFHQLPGLRALHDAARSLEYGFVRPL